VEVGGQPLCLTLRVREGVEVAFIASKHKTEGWRWVDNPSILRFKRERGGGGLCHVSSEGGVEVASVVSKCKAEGWRWVDNPSVEVVAA